MPYTPPSQLSPATSKASSPALSRSHSYSKAQIFTAEPPKTSPELPRSGSASSYLSRHRRSPSLNDVKEILHNGEAYSENIAIDPHGSLRISPPPVNNALIPTGMTISPPESSHNSSDEEDNNRRGRSRNLEDHNLKELQNAIRSIEQRRTGSPNRTTDDKDKTSSDPAQNGTEDDGSAGRPPLSKEARKISHSRSSTDSNIVFDTTSIQVSSPARFKQDSDEDDDEDAAPSARPSMVRKKSGELVRPALRPSSRHRRPSSMPGTPTYSKAVHFDSHLEHVRHFLQVDRPLAVSAGSSPVENYESETEFPFGGEEHAHSRQPPYEWEIQLSNFPVSHELEARKSTPVHVERVCLSSDKKHLIGSIACQNLAFQKVVIARFTFDYWKTTSELVAEFSHDIGRKQQDDGLDRFSFNIKLADQVNLENKTLFFCIRYTVNGSDLWDNNNGYNYQVDFTKKHKPQLGKHGKNGMPGLGARPLAALPRTRPSPPVSSGRPKSYPTSFDDFTHGMENTFDQSGEPTLRLRNPRPKVEIIPDAPPARRGKAPAQAFGNRYDFSASLTAAKASAFAALGELSGLSAAAETKQSSRDVPTAIAPSGAGAAPGAKPVAGAELGRAEPVSKAPAVPSMSAKPAAALISEKPALASQSYQELVEKYCFVGSARGKSEGVRIQ